MATIPLLAIGPNAILSILGLIHGRDKTVPTPAEDWSKAVVDVVIPCLNEEKDIALCLASLCGQTLRPRQVILVDDGSSDRTIELARSFAAVNGLNLSAIHRHAPIGKTPTLKRQARESDADVEFILDADTVLESPNYIERTVQELYQGVGIACACGTVLPIRNRDRHRVIASEPMQKFLEKVPDAPSSLMTGWFARWRTEITNSYREVLYLFLQRFVYVGLMTFFGTIINPVGCAVAYRRKYLKDLFDLYEPVLGDDLTNSEDIFIGFALLNEGYRNIQLTDIYCHTREPDVLHLPRQMYLWSSANLQSCLYFNALVCTPFKAFKRWRHLREMEKLHGAEIQEKRKIHEAYRQPFGREFTRQYGRPGGWAIFFGMVEKVGYFVVLLTLIITQSWKSLGATVGFEIVLFLIILMIVTPRNRLAALCRGILVQPLRYASVVSDLGTVARFATDIWIRKTHAWRK